MDAAANTVTLLAADDETAGVIDRTAAVSATPNITRLNKEIALTAISHASPKNCAIQFQ
jgi:hypothetical protein